jgi:PqqD family protein of HPr-rel-A system
VPTRWQLIRPDALRVREWDDAGVIYDAASGNTHLIDALGLELLDLLRQRPWRVDELLAELRDSLPEDLPAGDAPRLINAKLEQLARLDLAVATA